jgi:hypothetical protein
MLAPLEIEGKVLEGPLDDDPNYRSYLRWRREAGLEKQLTQ